MATVVNDVVIVDTSVKVGEAVDPADLGDVVPLLLVGQRLEVIKVPTEIMKLLILEKLYLITLLYRTIYLEYYCNYLPELELVFVVENILYSFD